MVLLPPKYLSRNLFSLMYERCASWLIYLFLFVVSRMLYVFFPLSFFFFFVVEPAGGGGSLVG